MGSSHSRSDHEQPQPSSPGSHAVGTATTPARRETRRRESVSALGPAKATTAPPSESHKSATAHAAQQLARREQRSSPRPHEQQKQPQQQQQRATSDDGFSPTTTPPVDEMGNQGSRAKPEHVEPKPFTPSKPVPVPVRNTSSSNSNSSAGVGVRDPNAKDVTGGAAAAAAATGKHESSWARPAAQITSTTTTTTTAATPDRDHVPPPQAHRPPRLPLPIEEEIYTPGSPIISPADITLALNQDQLETGLPRRSSLLSSTTADDEEAGDELQPYDADPGVKRAVPTLVEWKGRGDRVYVTGTFAGWNKKYRLHRNEGKDGLSTVIQLAPGTHHLKFLVDGDMRTADHLPTAVDFTNVLVNYIEVRADEPRPASKPIDIKAARPQHSAPSGVHPALVPPARSQGYHTEDDTIHAARHGQSLGDAHVGLTATAVERARAQDQSRRTGRDGDDDNNNNNNNNNDEAPATATAAVAAAAAAAAAERLSAEDAVRHWTTEVPRYLRDLDAAEGSQDQRRVTHAMGQMPPPPGLPGFLGRSILNGTTPIKDDSSVLNMPNHTVLNHLATSSIKDNVLATSVTTRYQNKYLTTIMYKPTDVKDM